MKTTIDQINNWLESRAQNWEKEIQQNPHLSGATWPEYYRGLKNFNEQEKFTISSCDLIRGWSDPSYIFPIDRYIQENNLKYTYEGGTGYCHYIKDKS